MSRYRLLMLIAVAAGCLPTRSPTDTTSLRATATAEPKAPAPDESNQPIEVHLQVEAMTRAGQRYLSPGDTLRSGDQTAFQVGVSQPAYVYVALLAANGSSSVLYPEGDEQLTKPGVPLRVPPVGQWLRLDDDIGQEDLFVYASHEPVPRQKLTSLIKADSSRPAVTLDDRDSGNRTVKIVHRPERIKRKAKDDITRARTPEAAAKSDSDTPGGIGSDTRGLIRHSEEPAANQVGGLTTVHFLIRHSR